MILIINFLTSSDCEDCEEASEEQRRILRADEDEILQHIEQQNQGRKFANLGDSSLTRNLGIMLVIALGIVLLLLLLLIMIMLLIMLNT